MKPKTKREIEVDELAHTLSDGLTERQYQEAVKRLFPMHYAKRQSKTVHHCYDCVKDYESTHTGKVERCPYCGRYVHLTSKKPEDEYKWFALLQRVGNYQVVRYFLLVKAYYNGDARIVNYGEECQMWLAEDGYELARAKDFKMFYQNMRNPFVLSGELKLKDTKRYYGGYLMYADMYNFIAKVHVVSLLPIFRKYGGYKENAQGPLDTLRLLLSSPHHATLYETKQMDVFGHTSRGKLDYPLGGIEGAPSVWDMVKICTRRGYIIRDFSMWHDMVKMYGERGKDLHSPKYLCIPYNELRNLHDRMERRKRREEQIREMERTGENLLKDKKLRKQADKDYRNMVGVAMLAIEIKKGDLQIAPLQNIQEFFDEGINMSHCVFTNKYYKRKNSIILSARSNGKRLATIELSRDKLRIMQCRGPHNSEPKRDKEIRQLIENNVGLLRRAAMA